MGRRGEHGLEKIKEMAIEAAEELVAQGGISQLSSRKIASAIGYTPGTLYLVFKDIDDLVLQVNGRSLDKLQAVLTGAGAKHKDHPKAVLAMCRAYLAYSKENPGLWSLLFERHWGPGFTRPDWYQAKKQACFAPLAARLKALGLGHNERELAGLTRTLWASIHGTCALQEDDKLAQAGAWDSAKLLDLQVALFLKGAMDGVRGGA
jgi:AcrR family transcriptional regulator